MVRDILRNTDAKRRPLLPWELVSEVIKFKVDS